MSKWQIAASMGICWCLGLCRCIIKILKNISLIAYSTLYILLGSSYQLRTAVYLSGKQREWPKYQKPFSTNTQGVNFSVLTFIIPLELTVKNSGLWLRGSQAYIWIATFKESSVILISYLFDALMIDSAYSFFSRNILRSGITNTAFCISNVI